MTEYLEEFYGPQGELETAYLSDMDYILVECQTCGLLFQRQVLDDFLTHKLYEVWIDPQKALQRAFEKQTKISYFIDYSREISDLLAYFGTSPNQLKFLDFGMGWGYWCRMAAAFGVSVWGAELSESRIAHAETLGVKIMAWDDIPGQELDFINTEQVMEHLADPLEVLCHLVKGLKSGGVVKLSVPDSHRIKSRLQNPVWTLPPGMRKYPLNPVAPLEHLNGFTYRSLVTLAEKAGLSAVSLRPGPKRSLRERVKNTIFPWKDNKGTYQFFRKI